MKVRKSLKSPAKSLVFFHFGSSLFQGQQNHRPVCMKPQVCPPLFYWLLEEQHISKETMKI